MMQYRFKLVTRPGYSPWCDVAGATNPKEAADELACLVTRDVMAVGTYIGHSSWQLPTGAIVEVREIAERTG